MADYLPATIESIRGTLLGRGLISEAELDAALVACRVHPADPKTLSTSYRRRMRPLPAQPSSPSVSHLAAQSRTPRPALGPLAGRFGAHATVRHDGCATVGVLASKAGTQEAW